ncbi:MAG: hypothetical protein Q9180_007046 [Flavoplaca navasiana]
MAAPKRKRRNSPPSHSAPTQSSNAKRVKLSIPLQQGHSIHKLEISASKVPSHSKRILQNKRQREDDDGADEELDWKRRYTLCSRPKIKPTDGPQCSDNIINEASGKTLRETDEGIVAGAEGRPETVVPTATATSATCKGEQDGDEGAPAGEDSAESKTTIINNDGYEMPSVESDHSDHGTNPETSINTPVVVDFYDDVSSEEDSHDNTSISEEASTDSSSDADTDDDDDTSGEDDDDDNDNDDDDDDDNDDDDDDYPIDSHLFDSTHRSSSNRHTLTFSNETLISENIPSGAHLSRCKLVSCDMTNATLQSCRVLSCDTRSSTAENCSFVSCDLRDCWIGGCSVVFCDIRGGSAEGCSYRMSNMRI